MAFLDITVIPVPTANKAAYLDYCQATNPLFREFGALGVTEAWGVEVSDGKLTDFKKAVQLNADETVVVGWIKWPDRATRDAAWGKLMQDPRMGALQMPYDGSRMIFAGFDQIADD